MKTIVIGLCALAAAVSLQNIAMAQQKTDVKLGVLADMSGIFSDIGGEGSVIATRMAVEDFMKKPEAQGFKVEVVSADAQNKSDISSAIARKWFDTDGVHALVDMPTSAISLALAPLARDKNKVVLLTASGTSDLTGTACTPNSVHWTYDTWALAHGTADALTQEGKKNWYFLTVDFALGHSLERDASDVVKASGGKVLGSVRHPTDAVDFSSYLLQAQGSGADIIALANTGGDAINALKQAREFGMIGGNQTFAGMLMFLSDIHSTGLETAQGLLLTTGFYWDRNDQTRAFAERFAALNHGRKPTMNQAGAYSATLAYLDAVVKVGSPEDGAAVVRAMRQRETFEDPLFGKTFLREDGRVLHDMLLVQVKKPEESSKSYDYYKIVKVLPGDTAFRSIEEGGCQLVK
ncbi:ABC transporter substrate-binding protein [Ochrobactrum pecoris]|uniref:ABC transporter substrate-binding protein n=1 Tax=Brucella pecoris TaxID=867683 RepID=A0A5C5CE83_9HYPH|nr:ABC transporter substrate-binding protein [Brucella pecoris]MBB4095629.1 branched-chain amino acid transport system substrate-binding protein [Brucella pecoris]NKW81845.1 ABC transporter substrate-binding protein [Brucella pecoris]TNV09662.1 ABC transporter substrate-binding protein [Brucella pecoris]